MIEAEMEVIGCPTTIFRTITGRISSASWNGCRLLTGFRQPPLFSSSLATRPACKIAAIMQIARKTIRISNENIVFALGVKFLVLILGAVGSIIDTVTHESQHPLIAFLCQQFLHTVYFVGGLAGNAKLMEREHIPYTASNAIGTVVYVAFDGRYAPPYRWHGFQ